MSRHAVADLGVDPGAPVRDFALASRYRGAPVDLIFWRHCVRRRTWRRSIVGPQPIR